MRILLSIASLTVLLTGGTTTVPAWESGHSPSQAAAKPASSTDLDTLLAPIALYPDQLLAQMLVCAGNPGKVATLNEWLRSHANLSGTELQDAALASGFDPSFVALVLFPDVVSMMADRADWTRRLGEAFAADRSAVFASIQSLRQKAQQSGALKTSPQQEVETRTTSEGQQVIVIEPSNPQVVYVPQYNPQVVYTQPSTVVVHEDNSANAAAAGVIGFAAGIAIGAAIDNDYYYGPYGWRGGAYMYNDAWDDWYDEREDAREDWQDHREDMYEERGERAESSQKERTERQQTTQQERTDRTQARQQGAGATTQGATAASSATRPTQESRGYSGEARTSGQRSGTSSDAFSGYSSGKSEKAASSRGQKSRKSSRSGGSRRR